MAKAPGSQHGPALFLGRLGGAEPSPFPPHCPAKPLPLPHPVPGAEGPTGGWAPPASAPAGGGGGSSSAGSSSSLSRHCRCRPRRTGRERSPGLARASARAPSAPGPSRAMPARPLPPRAVGLGPGPAAPSALRSHLAAGSRLQSPQPAGHPAWETRCPGLAPAACAENSGAWRPVERHRPQHWPGVSAELIDGNVPLLSGGAGPRCVAGGGQCRAQRTPERLPRCLLSLGRVLPRHCGAGPSRASSPPLPGGAGARAQLRYPWGWQAPRLSHASAAGGLSGAARRQAGCCARRCARCCDTRLRPCPPLRGVPGVPAACAWSRTR